MLTTIVPALVAGTVSAITTPLVIRAGQRWRLLDEPDDRKNHPAAVPFTGGVAVMLGFGAGCLAASCLGAFDAAEGRLEATFFVATAIVFAVGVLEDVRGCPVAVRLLVQCGAAFLVVAGGYSIATVGTPFGMFDLGALAGSFVAIFWLVGITNALNLMDGLDGLAGGVSAIIAGSLVVFAAIQSDPASIGISLSLCGGCVGFLPWNWRPARVFLGDSGALTIGFVLAWLSLTASLKASTAVALFVPFLVLGVPAIDTLLVVGARFTESPTRQLGERIRRVVQADRLHLHHLLAGAGQRVVVPGLFGLVSLFCLLSLLAVHRSNPRLAVATLLTEIAVVVLLRRWRRRTPLAVPSNAARGELEPTGALAVDGSSEPRRPAP